MKSFKELKKMNLLTSREMSDLKGSGSYPSGTCGYYGSDGSIECGVNKAYAIYMADWTNGYWCCDSCAETSYCGIVLESRDA